MGDVTRILADIEQGDPRAAEQLLPLVYDELRRLAAQRMANETPDQTLQPTALVHEAYLQLVGPADENRWANRAHFFAAAADPSPSAKRGPERCVDIGQLSGMVRPLAWRSGSDTSES